MTDTLKQRIQTDMKEAMRAKQTERLSTIRMLMAAMKQREIDDKITLDDVGVLAIINKMIKQRQESAAQFKAAQRMELFAKENAEIEVLQAYLPQPLSAAEVDAAIQSAIKKTHASSIQDIGKVMAVLKSELVGRADMGAVSIKVKERLG